MNTIEQNNYQVSLLLQQGKYLEAAELFEQTLIIAQSESQDSKAFIINGVRAFIGSGKFTEAIPLLQSALNQQYGNLDNVEHIELLRDLAMIHIRQNHIVSSLECLEQCLTLSRLTYGDSHPLMVRCYLDMGSCYETGGRFSEAEQAFQQALELEKHNFGVNSDRYGATLSRFAWCLRQQGRFDEAETFLQMSLDIYKELYGDKDRSLIKVLSNLAGVCYAKGEHEKATKLMREAIDIGEQCLGVNHPTVAELVNNLARLHEFQQNMSEAETLYLRALEIRRLQLGTAHPDYGVSLNNLANFYQCPERSILLYEEAEKVLSACLGSEHPHVLRVRENLITFQKLKTSKEI